MKAIVKVTAVLGLLSLTSILHAAETPLTEVDFPEMRVKDVERSVAYYQDLIGLKVSGRSVIYDNPAVFFNRGAGGGASHGSFILFQVPEITAGDGFQRLIITHPDVRDLCKRLAAAQKPCTKEPYEHPSTKGWVAFANDPDGHELELMQHPTKVSTVPDAPAVGFPEIRVKDIERSVAFYTNVLGLELKSRGEVRQMPIATFGLDPKNGDYSGGMILFGTGKEIVQGNTMQRIVYRTKDVREMCKRLEAAKYPCKRSYAHPGGDWVAFGLDPDGYEYELMEPVPVKK